MTHALSPEQQKHLFALLEQGLPLVERPYLYLADQLEASEQQVLAQVQHWQAEGYFRRFGVVVKHRALGINANCMLVLDVPDTDIDQIGAMLADAAGVNLCYRRPRRPTWPYNLFCMVHGRCRVAVTEHIQQLLERHSLTHLPHRLLFSTRAFKQRGARYSMPENRHD